MSDVTQCQNHHYEKRGNKGSSFILVPLRISLHLNYFVKTMSLSQLQNLILDEMYSKLFTFVGKEIVQYSIKEKESF